MDTARCVIHRVIRSFIHKVLDVDEVGLAQPLPLALDEAAFALQLMQQLSGLLVGAAQGGHDLLDGEDDIHTSFFIQPAVLAAQAHAVKEQTVEHLGFCGNASEPFLREQHLGDAVEGELFRFRAVEIVIHGFCHAPLEALRRA